ncbi:ankyrin [Coniochaeta ligniaria NRRL 30616]|uniref:Ankyrin n=1 Tax=Coniochaeta ligniaria NRRL 30616 TaxID=1408157 RepID=A0A1J7JU99_9PEZI|nr:ankyrin [Coniochaeta ligniaria NRRL 30616]
MPSPLSYFPLPPPTPTRNSSLQSQQDEYHPRLFQYRVRYPVRHIHTLPALRIFNIAKMERVTKAGQASLALIFPAEILQHIAQYLSGKDHSALSRTCSYLNFILQAQLFSSFSFKGNYYPFVFGLKQGNTAIIKRTLLYRKPPSVNFVLGGGSTPLALAACLGHTSVVSYLLHRGADPCLAGEDGLSPLTHAIDGIEGLFQIPNINLTSAMERHARTTLKLLDHGAYAGYNLTTERTPGDEWAAPLFPLSYVMTLITSGFLSAHYGTRLVTKLLQNGADPNTLGSDGCSPIQAIIKLYDQPWLHVLRILLDYGADPNGRDAVGRNALWWVLETARMVPGRRGRRNLPLDTHIAVMLLRYGADPDLDAEPGRKPLRIVAENISERGKGLATMGKLLRYGANPNAVRDVKHGRSGTRMPLLVYSLLLSIDKLGYSAAKADFNTLAQLYEQTAACLGLEDSAYFNTDITMRMAPPRSWNNPLLPILLRFGAKLSRAGLELARTKLVILGGCLDGIHGVAYLDVGDLFLPTP